MPLLPQQLQRPLHFVDRFGDPSPKPKGTCQGVLSIGVYAFLVVYAVVIAIQYEHEPALQENSVLWSAYGGPYPLTLTCAAARCWASMSLRGAFGPCLHDVPDDQADTCLEMAHGDTVTLHSCYALLPSHGVRLYFEGATAERWEAIAPATGMGDASDAQHFGLFSVSDMLMPDYVMPTKTPLRAGLTMMTYVHTVNNSVAEGEPGNDRHEWFSQILDQAPTSEPDNAPCAANVGPGVSTSVLRMAPDFTKIKVTPNPPYWAALFGEVGGALAACDELFGVFLVVAVNIGMLYWNRSVQAPASSVEPAKGDEAIVDVEKATPAVGMEERVQQMVAEATADLTRRLTEAEAALEKHDRKLKEVFDGPPDTNRPDSNKPTEPQPQALANSVDDAKGDLTLDTLDKRLKIFEEASTRESTDLDLTRGKVIPELRPCANLAVVELGANGASGVPSEVVPKEPRVCGLVGCG